MGPQARLTNRSTIINACFYVIALIVATQVVVHAAVPGSVPLMPRDAAAVLQQQQQQQQPGHAIQDELGSFADHSHPSVPATAPSGHAGAAAPPAVGSWPQADALIDWILAAGGEVNVVVREAPYGGRTTYAARDVQPGDVLARVPMKLAYRARSSDGQMSLDAPRVLLEEMRNPQSRWAPYWASLPTFESGEISSLQSLPPAYLPLLGCNATAASILSAQSVCEETWRTDLAAGRTNATLAETRFAMNLLMTRLFNFLDDGLLLLPLLDLTDHRNDCPNVHPKQPCHPGSAEECVVWIAREYVAAGQPVCNYYKWMTNDISLLQYGWLQEGPAADELVSMDRHEFDADSPWAELPPGRHGPPRFEGGLDQLVAEQARLASVHQTLAESEADVAAITADPADPGGRLLSSLRAWRALRVQALENEGLRLARQEARLRAQEAALLEATADPSRSARQQSLEALHNQLAERGATFAVEIVATAEPLIPDDADQQQPLETTGGSDNSTDVNGSAVAEGTMMPSTSVRAARSVPAGQLLAAVPLALTRLIPNGVVARLDAAKSLMVELRGVADCKDAPDGIEPCNSDYDVALLGSLPLPGSLPGGLYHLAASYEVLLQHEGLASTASAARVMLNDAWERSQPSIEDMDKSLSRRELAHTATLITSMALPYDDGARIVPLLSHSNVRRINGCPHDDSIGPCPPGTGAPGDECVLWYAGRNVEVGEELCTRLGPLLPDAALLQHGVLLRDSQAAGEVGIDRTGGAASVLHGLDLAGYDDSAPFTPPRHNQEQEVLAKGSAEEREAALSEAVRLAVLHARLTAPSAAAVIAAVKVDTSDVGGRTLALLRAWRQRRIAAVEREVARLAAVHGMPATELAVLVDRTLAAGQLAGSSMGGGASVTDVGVVLDGSSDTTTSAIESEGQDIWTALTDWLHSLGGEVSALGIRDAGEAGRVPYTLVGLRRGQLLAALPVDAAFSFARHGGNGSLELAAAHLAAAIAAGRHHPLAPYLATLPTPGQLLCPLAQLPESYLDLLGSNITVNDVTSYQADLEDYWQANDQQLTALGVTHEAFVHARALISTRFFGGGGTGAGQDRLLIPLLDMANHDNACPHMTRLGPCPGDPNAECFLWLAGSWLPPGAEVCNWYHHVAGDAAALQYGYLAQDGSASLHQLDRPRSGTTTPGLQQDGRHGPAPFDGSLAEVRREIGRLEALRDSLASDEAQLAAATPDPADPSGKLLDLLRGWRTQRSTAILSELARLVAREAELAAVINDAAETGTADGPHDDAPVVLRNWLMARGAALDSLELDSATTSLPAQPVLRTAHDVPAGGILAVLPLSLAVPLGGGDPLEDALDLWKESQHPRAVAAPFWAALAALPAHPPSMYSLPSAYLPLLQNEALAAHISGVRASVEAAAADAAEDLVQARGFDLDPQGQHFLPWLHWASFSADCPHQLGVEACPDGVAALLPGGSPECIMWRAGSDVRRGDTPCAPRSPGSSVTLAPDVAAVVHGVVLADAGASSLSLLDDEHQAAASTAPRTDAWSLPWQQAASKHSDLAAVLDALKADEEAVAKMVASPEDEGGAMLAVLRAWRAQRRTALERALVQQVQ